MAYRTHQKLPTALRTDSKLQCSSGLGEAGQDMESTKGGVRERSVCVCG